MPEHAPDRPDRAEQAFRDALARHADDLDPRPLDPPVRRRRPLLPVLAAAAAAVVVVAVVGLVASKDTTSSDVDAATTEETAATTTASTEGTDTRTVSYRDVEVTVPTDWGDEYEPGPDWCANEGDTRLRDQPPYVAIQDTSTIVLAIGCDVLLTEDGQVEPDGPPTGFPKRPVYTWAPSLVLSDAAGRGAATREEYEGWVSASRVVGSVRVTVLADAATAPIVDAILDSAEVVEVDSWGCDTTSPIQQREPSQPPESDLDAADDATSVVVCSYGVGNPDRPGLLGSRVITGREAQELLGAVRAAPAQEDASPPMSCGYGDSRSVVLRFRDGDRALGDVYGYVGRCSGDGLYDGTGVSALTPEVCKPLWDGRVQLPRSGSASIYRTCHPG